ncbi:hypothetical protein NP493_188g08080 [Ridgeia piscesae]|uniref:Uncharacterized protein n=1 Tax=Ridgeia piscesae TaxID=27915 RepID=A0AAD9P293_RIDPI|nr:hypothetical protein NP493_188g08080 [Ridgeia piscesae]
MRRDQFLVAAPRASDLGHVWVNTSCASTRHDAPCTHARTHVPADVTSFQLARRKHDIPRSLTLRDMLRTGTCLNGVVCSACHRQTVGAVTERVVRITRT